MAQRADDDQPDGPDLGAAVQLDAGDTLAGPPGSDPLDAGYVPPDRPLGLDDDAVTAAGQREGESLDERLSREVPEQVSTDADRSGRLTAAAPGADGEPTNAMDGVDVGIDGGAASAEEAAVHDVDLGIEPVDDESPLGDPAVAESLAQDPDADAAMVDAARDARAGDAADGRGERDLAAGVDAAPDTGGAAAAASGRRDAGDATGLPPAGRS